MKILAFRWLKFSAVGGLGILVQLAGLFVFKDILGLHYLIATVLAIECALLHNFFVHDRVTWKDRRGGTRETLLRLVRFHVGNGLISIIGNVLLMRWLVGSLHVYYLLANIMTIALCSFANFAASEWFVFRKTEPYDTMLNGASRSAVAGPPILIQHYQNRESCSILRAGEQAPGGPAAREKPEGARGTPTPLTKRGSITGAGVGRSIPRP